MTYDASTVFLHLLFSCAFQIYINPGAGCGFFFLLLFCGCVCACSFLNWCGAGGSACAVFCNLILISCRAFVVFYMFFDRVCETAPAPALLSLPHTWINYVCPNSIFVSVFQLMIISGVCPNRRILSIIPFCILYSFSWSLDL